MENEVRKLTGRVTGRYDRNMPETSEALLENIDPKVLNAWMPQYQAAKTQDERSAIWAAIKTGVMPSEKSVDDMTKKEVDRKFKEITDEERKRRRTEYEENIDRFVKSLSNTEKLRGPSHPEYKVNGKKFKKELLREETNWREIGWGKQDTENVKSKLRQKFTGKHALDNDQIKNTIDLLIASGKTASKVAQEIEQAPLDYTLTQDDIRAARGSVETAIGMKKLEWFGKLNIPEKYVQRFILQENFAEENERDYQYTDPSTIEEIAWQVMHHYGHKTWGPNGTFPLLEMRIARDKNGRVDPEKSKYYVNQSNFVRWARERMWNLWDVNNDVGDFISAIDLPKTMGKMDFGRMFPEYTKYFASEDKETQYYEMAQELIVESYGLGLINQMNVQYKKEMRDPEGLQKAIGEMFASNAFTKETFRKNLFELMSIIPLNYEGQKPGDLPERDGIFGAAMMEMFLVYYNLSDFDELQKIIGKGSSFFTKEGFVWALQTVVEEKTAESSGESKPTFLNAETLEYLEKAFDKNGLITTESNRDNFIKLINFFGYKTNNEDAEYVVRRLLYRMATEKYGRVLKKVKKDERGEDVVDANGNKVYVDDTEFLYMSDPVTGEKLPPKEIKKYGFTSDVQGRNNDEWSLKMAWVASFAMARVFGAGARNDTTAAGYDGFTKWHLGTIYREKAIRRGDKAGNRLTIPQLKMFVMDPFNAILTESKECKRDENGNIKYKMKDGKPVLNKYGEKIPETRAKPVMQVLREMQEAMTAYNSRLKLLEQEYNGLEDGPEKQKKLKEINDFRKEMNRNYQNVAGQLAFKNRAMSNYYDDHLMRGNEIWQTIMKAGEITMEKYVVYDALRGVSFNRAEFQKDVQDQFIHPIRYFLYTYPDVDYSHKARMLDQAATIRKGRPIHRVMTLGEAMFGHELLNREQFWKKDPKTHKPINMVDDRGRPMKGIYEIDYDKVNKDKMLVWKQWFMTKLAADLHAHRDFHSHDSKFDISYYKNVLKAIESIPATIDADEFSLTHQVLGENFFNKRDMKWFRREIKVENYDLYLRAIFRDLLQPEDPQTGIGLLEALSLATRYIIKQGG